MPSTVWCSICRQWTAPSRDVLEHKASAMHLTNEAQLEAPDRRERTYRLRFDNAEDEVIRASSPALAVARRVNARLPYQMTDETTIGEWLDRMATPATPAEHSMPIRARRIEA